MAARIPPCWPFTLGAAPGELVGVAAPPALELAPEPEPVGVALDDGAGEEAAAEVVDSNEELLSLDVEVWEPDAAVAVDVPVAVPLPVEAGHEAAVGRLVTPAVPHISSANLIVVATSAASQALAMQQVISEINVEEAQMQPISIVWQEGGRALAAQA